MEEKQKYYVGYVQKCLKSYSRWTKCWSFLHHSFLFGAAFLSAGAALILTTKPDVFENDTEIVAAVLSAIAALLGVIAGSGGFQRKWKTNRLTKSSLEQIQIDLLGGGFDENHIKARLKETIRNHHNGIIDE